MGRNKVLFVTNSLVVVKFLQTSPESPGIFVLLMKLFRHHTVTNLINKAKEECNAAEEEIKVVEQFNFGVLTYYLI